MCTSILHGSKAVLASGCSVWQRNWSKGFSANSFTLLQLQLSLPSAVLSPLNSFMEKAVNMKSCGNLILRLSKQIWHQTFCPAQAGSEADTSTVTLKWNALYSQITVPWRIFDSWLTSTRVPQPKFNCMHLSTQLNVYLDMECHNLTWGQCQTLLGWGEEKLISWTATEIPVWREGCF